MERWYFKKARTFFIS